MGCRFEGTMGNSTISLEECFDYVAGKSVPDPRARTGGYGTRLAIRLGNDTLNDLISQRFNWKFNRSAPRILSPYKGISIYTNSYQQDYPLVGITDIAWLEDCTVVDINNTSVPPPLRSATVVKQLSRMGQWVGNGPLIGNQSINWMYNKDMAFGQWPGAGMTYSPLITAQVVQNPIMSMIDANENLLIVTTFGTTGTVAPVLPAESDEGTTVVDGSVVWTVVAPNGQGFRIGPLPGPTGPVYQFTPYYQKVSPQFLNLQQMIDPFPDDYSTTFMRGLEFQCKGASDNPAFRKEFKEDYPLWLNEMEGAKKQGDRENNAYGAIPASVPVEETWGNRRNPQDPSEPY